MKLIKTTAIALMAFAGLASCSKDDNNGNDPGTDAGTQSLSIVLGQPQSQPEGRAVGESQANVAAPVTFSDGELFLVNAANVIVDVYTFSSTAATSGKTIKISDATATGGVTITNVPGSVVSAYIVGNSSSITADSSDYATKAVKDQPISAIKDFTMLPAMSSDLADATLWGEGTLVQDPNASTDPDKKYVKIELRPHVARIELSDIKSTANNTGVTVTEYNVKGIYMNNYLESISMDWETSPSIKDWGRGGLTMYNSVTNGGRYPDNLSGIYYDESATNFGNTATTNLKLPDATDNTKVWGYNLLAAPKFGSASFQNATTAAPHIVIQVQGVKGSNGVDYPDFRYITVGKLYEMDGTTEITVIEAGKVYKIAAGDFEFTLDNVYVEAETEKIDLRCEVEVIGWTTEGMRPGLN